VFAGDFNSTPPSPLLSPLERAGFVDSFAMSGAGLGLSFPVFGRYRSLPLPPLLRIDHVFLRGSLAARRARFVPGAGSDHRALLVVAALEESG
jgi:endonuclease/exonuclease/phosphatase (EEP) superfamily protein YafD